ncbi:MAG: sulfatase [Phycisphaeraceae bacterium]
MKRLPIALLLVTSLFLSACHATSPPSGTAEAANKRVNVLMISIDDLNDWVGCLGGHPQARTPNIDRLARESVLFTNAHSPAPSCNPCRTAVLTGLAPWRSGVYNNNATWRDALPDVVTLPAHFRQNGWTCRGGGKFFHHYQNDVDGWDTYFPEVQQEFPEGSFAPKDLTYRYKPTNDRWYREFVWGPFLPEHNADEHSDQATVNHIVGLLDEIPSSEAFFMNCGIYRPHVPWYVPQKYFDAFPLELVQMPASVVDDLVDLPAKIKERTGRDPYYKALDDAGVHREATQAYLASVLYMDEMVGQVLDALDKSDHADNTIVVFWSDHGYHMGEKKRYRKFSLWDDATHVPVIIRLPPSLKMKWAAGEPCHEAVSLQDLYPTLMELADLQPPHKLDGQSLVPLLIDPSEARDEPAITVNDWNTAYAIRTEQWTYIQREDGEELYDRVADPHQWHNLASDPQHRVMMDVLAKHIPTEQAERFRNTK